MLRKTLGFLWSPFRWSLALLWDMLIASLWYFMRRFLGFFAGLLHNGLFVCMLVALIVYWPHALSTVYQWHLELAALIPGVDWLTTKIVHVSRMLGSAATLMRLDADWADRLKLAVFIPWTPFGWLLVFELYLLVGAILNIPAFLLERSRKQREIDLQAELKRAQAEAQKWRPREGEILLPEKKPPAAELSAPRRLLLRQK